MHPAFEWNDQTAGEHWREHQAGEIIRSVVTTYAVEEVRNHKKEVTQEVTVRAYLPEHPRGPSKGYKPVEEIILQPETRQAHLTQFWIDFKTFKRRWAHLTEAVELLDKFEGELKKWIA